MFSIIENIQNDNLRFTNLQLEFGVIYHCLDGTLYTGRRSHGAFCNGVRLRVSKEKGWCYLFKFSLVYLMAVFFFGTELCESKLFWNICVNESFSNDPFLLFISDVSKALILTEIGAKREPHTLDIFLGNMKQLLSAPVHGWDVYFRKKLLIHPYEINLSGKAQSGWSLL